MTITREDVLLAEKNAAEANRIMSEARRKFALQECPIRVGDIVECAGYSHKGKKMQVDSVLPPKYSFDGDWRVCGTILNKDEKPGKTKTSFSHKNWNGRA